MSGHIKMNFAIYYSIHNLHLLLITTKLEFNLVRLLQLDQNPLSYCIISVATFHYFTWKPQIKVSKHT